MGLSFFFSWFDTAGAGCAALCQKHFWHVAEHKEKSAQKIREISQVGSSHAVQHSQFIHIEKGKYPRKIKLYTDLSTISTTMNELSCGKTAKN